jgi:hypothetical protein
MTEAMIRHGAKAVITSRRFCIPTITLIIFTLITLILIFLSISQEKLDKAAEEIRKQTGGEVL